MAFGDFFTGTQGKFQSVPRLSTNQIAAQNQGLSMGLQQLQNPTGNFAPIANRARKQFSENTLPSIAERFTALGGGQRSGAFQHALGRAGSDLESSLAALESQYGLQQQGLGQQLLGLGLQPQGENAYIGGQPGVFQNPETWATIAKGLQALLLMFGV